jgi:hypothetical protein
LDKGKAKRQTFATLLGNGKNTLNAEDSTWDTILNWITCHWVIVSLVADSKTYPEKKTINKESKLIKMLELRTHLDKSLHTGKGDFMNSA